MFDFSVGGAIAGMAFAGVSAAAVSAAAASAGAGGVQTVVVTQSAGSFGGFSFGGISAPLAPIYIGNATLGPIGGGGAAQGLVWLFLNGAPLLCYVAREVYGLNNPKWIQFRYWLLNSSPKLFKKLYINHGQDVAKFISNKPILKTAIRFWMDYIIKKNNLENEYCFSS